MYKLRVMNSAVEDIRSNARYISAVLSNAVAARNLITEIEKAFERIVRNPYMYELYGDKRLADKGYRKVTVKNYMIFYIVDEENKIVNIMRVIYGRRDHSNLIQ